MAYGIQSLLRKGNKSKSETTGFSPNKEECARKNTTAIETERYASHYFCTIIRINLILLKPNASPAYYAYFNFADKTNDANSKI